MIKVSGVLVVAVVVFVALALAWRMDRPIANVQIGRAHV